MQQAEDNWEVCDCGCFMSDALCKGELKWLKYIQDNDKAHVFSIIIKGAVLIFRLVHLKKDNLLASFLPWVTVWSLRLKTVHFTTP